MNTTIVIIIVLVVLAVAGMAVRIIKQHEQGVLSGSAGCRALETRGCG
jgi:regulator of protease activity HflC (stomatin/prohibitin superfamily)